MSTSQVLDQTFSLYKKNFALFAGIAALPPALILVGQALMLPAGPVMQGTLNSFGSMAGVFVGFLVFLVLYLVGAALATGASVYAVSRLHLGNAITIGEAYRRVQHLVGRLIGIMLLVGLRVLGAILVGYLGIIVPMVALGALSSQAGGGPIFGALGFLIGFGLFVAALVWSIRIYCRYCLAVPACVVEGNGVSDSLRRSKFLSQGSLGRIFLIYFLMGILGAALSVALSIPNYIGLSIHQGKPTLPFQIWGLVASFLGGTIAGPIATIAIALVYYDTRVRKEAFDLQLMMQAIGEPPPPAAAGSVSAGIG
jgi:hypothetical protein